jgi:hypothetical protein
MHSADVLRTTSSSQVQSHGISSTGNYRIRPCTLIGKQLKQWLRDLLCDDRRNQQPQATPLLAFCATLFRMRSR